MAFVRLLPYRLRLLLGTLSWGVLEARWRGEGPRGIAAYLRSFARALPHLVKVDLSTPRFYGARWEDVRDVDALRRGICEFLTAACNRAPRPYGDGRFRLAILVGGAPIGREPFVEFSFRDLPRLKEEILEEWFPHGLGEWKGRDFEAVLVPVGAFVHDVPLRPIPGGPGRPGGGTPVSPGPAGRSSPEPARGATPRRRP